MASAADIGSAAIAAGAAGAAALMDTSAPATPRAAPTAGESPGAKQPARRTNSAADTPTPTREMTMQETTHALQRIMAQQANDAVWGETLIASLDDHSRRLNVEKSKTTFLNDQVKALAAQIVEMDSRMTSYLKVIEDNDKNTKFTIEESDAATKRVIEASDAATKAIIEANDAKVKAVIESLGTSLAPPCVPTSRQRSRCFGPRCRWWVTLHGRDRCRRCRSRAA